MELANKESGRVRNISKENEKNKKELAHRKLFLMIL